MNPQTAKPSNWEQAKAAIIAILIGSAISVIAELSQYAIAWLRDYPLEYTGSAAGMLKYVAWRILNHRA